MRDRPCHQAASRSLRPQYILYVQHLWQTTIISYHTYYVSTRLPESITQHHPSAFRTRTSCSELHTTYECPATLAAVYQAQGIRHLVLHTGKSKNEQTVFVCFLSVTAYTKQAVITGKAAHHVLIIHRANPKTMTGTKIAIRL